MRNEKEQNKKNKKENMNKTTGKMNGWKENATTVLVIFSSAKK